MDLHAIVRKIVGKFGERSAHPDSDERSLVERWVRGGIPDAEIQKISVFSDGHGDFHTLFSAIRLGCGDGPVSLNFPNDTPSPGRYIDLADVKRGFTRA